MNRRLLAVAAVLAILTGCGVAYCDNRGDEPPAPAPVDCIGVMWAAPAATKRGTVKTGPDARREARREPRGERRAPELRKASPRPSKTGRKRLDLDGC